MTPNIEDVYIDRVYRENWADVKAGGLFFVNHKPCHTVYKGLVRINKIQR